MWKILYSRSSGDHGTLSFFRNHLHRIPVTADPKKDMNACVDLIYTVMKGHILACACEVLKVSSLEGQPTFPMELKKAGKVQQLAFINEIALAVVEKCTLVEDAFTGQPIEETEDGMYNYSRVLCHFGSLVMEIRDAWAEGDGQRITRCWKLLMPHFKSSGHPKYALQSLRLQMQTNVTLSPNLAHQVKWNRFVNVRGGLGKNIPCDLYNEHINASLKHIIGNMGPNLTEKALHRAAQCVSALDTICERFDMQSGVPHRSVAHSTRSDIEDVKKVMATVSKHNLLTPLGNRKHRSFPEMALNPLSKWDVEKTKKWISAKKIHYLKYKRNFRSDINIA